MTSTLIFLGIVVVVVLFTIFILKFGESDDEKDPMVLGENDYLKEETNSEREAVEVNNSSLENPVARILLVLGVTEIIIGLICGIVFGQVQVDSVFGNKTEFSFMIFFTWFISTLVSGLLIIGFSEVIRLLNSINNKTDKSIIEEQREVS